MNVKRIDFDARATNVEKETIYNFFLALKKLAEDYGVELYLNGGCGCCEAGASINIDGLLVVKDFLFI